MEDNTVSIIGRIEGKKKRKNTFFIYLDCPEGRYQFVIKDDEELIHQFNSVNGGDIVRCQGVHDSFKNARFKINCPSFLLMRIEIVNKRIVSSTRVIDKSKIEEYSQAKNRVRSFLSQSGYIEVPIPVLTDGEISSAARSFVTESVSGKKLFLRKTMDVFLRMYSGMDFHKVYSIGPCFRNCFPTQTHVPEFEMLSIFTNYQSMDDAIIMVGQLVRIVLNNSPTIHKIGSQEYENLDIKDGIWLITGYNDSRNSYAEVNSNGTTQEFKLKINGVTVSHGVMELQDIKSYRNKLEAQGRKTDYGELVHLEETLLSAAPPCFNIGFSIIRTLIAYNRRRIIDYDCFSISRLNQSLNKRKDGHSE